MGRCVRICLLAIAFAASTMPGAGAAGPGVTAKEIKAEKVILKRVNAYRVKKGLSELVHHNTIMREARKHSNFMANKGKLSHAGFADRVARISDDDAGINPNKVCELTASAQGYDRPAPVAKRMVNAWKRTGKHRRCLIDVDFATHSVGIGVEHRRDTWYATFIAANDSTP